MAWPAGVRLLVLADVDVREERLVGEAICLVIGLFIHARAVGQRLEHTAQVQGHGLVVAICGVGIALAAYMAGGDAGDLEEGLDSWR